MLNPSYLLHAVEPAEEIAEQLHIDIVRRIVERIVIRFQRGDDYTLTALDKWQIETLQEAGFLLEDIQKEIAAATGKMQKEIVEAMEDAGVIALEYDDKIYRDAGLDPVPLVQSPYMIQLMQDTYTQTIGEWRNFTNISKRAVHSLFVEACDTAYMQALSGTISSSQAYLEALEKIVEGGVYVQYPGGRKDTIETATARAVRTGISQASGRIQLARMDEMDVDLVLVSSHLGARPEHYVWQGKVYTRSGLDARYPHFETVTGYGTVTGLCGANCRHNFSPYFEGMRNPFEEYDSEENEKQYEMEQRQRTLERRIRNTKRETMGWRAAMDAETDPIKKAEAEAKYQRKAALLQQQNKAYNNFCEETGQKKRYERITIAKWNRSEAAKARAAAKKAQKSIETTEINGIINKRTTNRKINDRGKVLNPMPKDEYAKIRDSLEAQGVKVVAATGGDDLAYMMWLNAEGTYSNGWLTHIGEIPSRGTLYEEIIHMTQARKYGELDSSDYVELYAREIEANRKLLKYSNEYKLDNLDVEDIERNLKIWEESFKRRTGVSYDESNYR